MFDTHATSTIASVFRFIAFSHARMRRYSPSVSTLALVNYVQNIRFTYTNITLCANVGRKYFIAFYAHVRCLAYAYRIDSRRFVRKEFSIGPTEKTITASAVCSSCWTQSVVRMHRRCSIFVCAVWVGKQNKSPAYSQTAIWRNRFDCNVDRGEGTVLSNKRNSIAREVYSENRIFSGGGRECALWIRFVLRNEEKNPTKKISFFFLRCNCLTVGNLIL